MNYINLSDMKLSQIVLGTDGYGERIDKKTAFELMELYVKNVHRWQKRKNCRGIRKIKP